MQQAGSNERALSDMGRKVVNAALRVERRVSLSPIGSDGQRRLFENLLRRWLTKENFDYLEYLESDRLPQLFEELGVEQIHPQVRTHNSNVGVDWGDSEFFEEFPSLKEVHELWGGAIDTTICQEIYDSLDLACIEHTGHSAAGGAWWNQANLRGIFFA